MRRPPELTFWEHVGALRAYLLTAAGILAATTTLAFTVLTDRIIALLIVPLDGRELVFLTILGPLLFKLQVSLLTGIALALPGFLLLIARFVAPSASWRTWTAIIGLVGTVIAVGLLSVVAAYLLLVPAALSVLLAIALPGTAVLVGADSYLAFILMQIVVAFVILELPVLIVGASAMGLFDPAIVSGRRAYLYAGLLITLAILTPTTDVVSLAIAFLPAVLTTEGGLQAARVIHARRQRRQLRNVRLKA